MEHLPDLIRRAEQHLRQFSGSLLDTDLTPPQSRVMHAIFEQNRVMNQNQITKATGIDRSTLSDLIVRLIGRGLLARSRSAADSRSYDITLTPMGLEKIAGLIAQREKLTATITQRTTEDDRAAAQRFLRAVCGIPIQRDT